jgi:hypothetical protein
MKRQKSTATSAKGYEKKIYDMEKNRTGIWDKPANLTHYPKKYEGGEA